MSNNRQWLADMWTDWASDPDAYFETRTDDGWVRAAKIPYNPSEQNQWRVVHPKKKEPDPRYATADDLIKLWEQLRDTGGHLEYVHGSGEWIRAHFAPNIDDDMSKWRVVPKEKPPLEVWVNEYSNDGSIRYYSRAHPHKNDANVFKNSDNYIRTIHLVEVKE